MNNTKGLKQDIKKIYQKVGEEINQISLELKSKSEKSLVDVENIFKQLKQNVIQNLDELEANAEWDIFTIAFYGETNAGKSTIIETLRLAFNEKSKAQSQEKFKSIYADADIQLASFEAILQKCKVDIDAYIQDLAELESQFTLQKEALLTIIQDESTIHEQNKQDSLLYRLKSWFKATPLSKSIAAHKNKLNSLQKAFQTDKKHKEKAINSTKQKEQNTFSKQSELLESLKQLIPYEDGFIMNGETDYTKEIKHYDFITANGERFILLDVPGIEGNENEVKQEIKKVTQKAHCIFYVTHKNTPPQSVEKTDTPLSEDNKGGILEKIKSQLGAQSEVYTLYNKKVNNLKGLEQNFLEQKDRQNIDSKMQEVLGKQHYKGTKSISAQIAFYALATCLIPQNKRRQARDKLLKEKSSNELLKLTQFDEFKTFLESTLIQNSSLKIKQSNYNKARDITYKCIDALKKPLETLDISYITIKRDSETCCNEIDNALRVFKNSMEKELDDIIDNLIHTARNETYEFIGKDVKDEEVKDCLKQTLENYSQDFSDETEEKIKECEKGFQEHMQKALERLQYRLEQTLEELGKFSFSSNIGTISMQTDSGFDVFGFFTSLGGGAVAIYWIVGTNWWNPIGWITMGLTVVATLIGIGKAVFKFFSTSYKMSEQRKSVDKALNKIESKIKEEMQDSLEKVFESCSANLSQLKEDIMHKVALQKQSIDNLKKSENSLVNLAKFITKEGELK